VERFKLLTYIGRKQEWAYSSQLHHRHRAAAFEELSARWSSCAACWGAVVSTGQCGGLQWLCGIGTSWLGQGNVLHLLKFHGQLC